MPRILHPLSHLINGRLAQDQKSFQTLANKNDKVGLYPQRVHVLIPQTQHPILGCKLQQTRILPRKTEAQPLLRSAILPHVTAATSCRAGYSLAAVSQHSIHLAAVMSSSICGTPWKVALTCIAHSLNSPTGSQRTGRSPRFTCLQHNQGLWWHHHNFAPHPSQEWIKTLPLDCRMLRQVDSETRSR